MNTQFQYFVITADVTDIWSCFHAFIHNVPPCFLGSIRRTAMFLELNGPRMVKTRVSRLILLTVWLVVRNEVSGVKFLRGRLMHYATTIPGETVYYRASSPFSGRTSIGRPICRGTFPTQDATTLRREGRHTQLLCLSKWLGRSGLCWRVGALADLHPPMSFRDKK